jgi:aminopeptidase
MVSKVLEPDPIAAWDAHADGLEARQNWLNERRFTAVHFLGAGTDLMVGLAEGAVWKGGWGHAQNGVKCAPNIPTEEIFTAPHRARVDGVVRSTKPLSNRGQIIDGIEMEFKDGVAVRASASAGEEALIRLLDTDEGARRLGEVALVPASSGVSRSGLLWLNTLYDENAACHIALGRCYSENFDGALDKGKDELTALGGNDSVIHVDWMIGSAEVAVTGIGADGSRTPILAGGDWAF